LILLEPMPEPDLQAYLAETIPAFADDKVKAGTWLAEEALEKSRQSYEELLPEGTKSPRQYLYNIIDTTQGMTVGMLWFGVLADTSHSYAFIYELHVFKAYQRRGFGKRAMLALEGEVKKLGLDRISLHVFGHNRPAQALYDQLGYMITDINMAKRL
jgi:ribosomal protein S18 acetylase RimI-like enzyme